MNVEKINIQQAADILESASLCEIVRHGSMCSSILTINGEKMVLVQSTGEEFLLIR